MPNKRNALAFYGAIQPRQYTKLAYAITETGAYVVDQRGRGTYEVINANLTLGNPLDRVVTHPKRNMNLGFAFAEFMSELIGDDSLAVMRAFIKGYGRFSTDGYSVDGSYAARLWRVDDDRESQVLSVIDILKADPTSRRAVMTFYDGPSDLDGGGGLNTPCTLSMQFLLRSDFLHAITTMRSNDYHLGLTYDVFNFTMLQEFVARRLGAEVGQYFHNDGSLHVYEDDISTMMEIEAMPMPWTRIMKPMPVQAANEMVNTAYIYCQMASEADRGELEPHFKDYLGRTRTQYCKDILAVGYTYLSRKTNPHHAMNVALMIEDETLRYVTLNSFANKA